ncbi:MAG: heat-inducible transcription repressor HrcA [Epulopiscium sp.]|nr:heat-inducible transcription repressor HrcA [Candidatus Epulonipiscium sp.]
MDLNKRKLQILHAIISDYLETAEPVGSRTISKKYNLGISSATIRNEMADLEELGFIIQPHTSAGRIPSDQGYRLYVEQLMDYSAIEIQQLEIVRQIITEKIDKIESMIQDISKLVAMITNYTTLISTPQTHKAKLKHIQLVPLDERTIIIVTVTDSNLVRNHLLNIVKPISSHALIQLSNMLNQALQGLTLEEMNSSLIGELKQQMGEYGVIMEDVFHIIVETIQSVNEPEIYLSGAIRILDFPEFNDVLKAKTLFHALEEKEFLTSILSPKPSKQKHNNISITIGNENPVEEMKDCSIVTTTYKMGDQTVGTIGILGPTRMDYGRVVATLSNLVEHMDHMIRGLMDG